MYTIAPKSSGQKNKNKACAKPCIQGNKTLQALSKGDDRQKNLDALQMYDIAKQGNERYEILSYTMYIYQFFFYYNFKKIVGFMYFLKLMKAGWRKIMNNFYRVKKKNIFSLSVHYKSEKWNDQDKILKQN